MIMAWSTFHVDQRVANWQFPVAGCRLPVASCRLPVTGCGCRLVVNGSLSCGWQHSGILVFESGRLWMPSVAGNR
jgi:hypothetical protein